MQINFQDLPVEQNAFSRQLVPNFEKIQSGQTTDTQNIDFVQKENLSKLETVLAENNISLNFSRDEQSDQLVVKLVDNTTGEEIRQFPNEVSLKLSALFVKLQGQIIDEKG